MIGECGAMCLVLVIGGFRIEFVTSVEKSISGKLVGLKDNFMEFTKLEITNLKHELPDFGIEGAWIAGGAVRDAILGVERSDIDVFCNSYSIADKFKAKLLETSEQLYSSANVTGFKHPKWGTIQLILRFYPSIESCLDSFDFTICQFALDKNKIICGAEGLVHLFKKELVVHKLGKETVFNSLERTQKYIKKGFSLSSPEFIKIAKEIHHLTEEELYKQFNYYGANQHTDSVLA